MDTLKEECGVVAAYYMGRESTRNVYPIVVRALLELQNRGQLSAGLTSFNPARDRILQTHKDLGSVNEVFRLHNPRKSTVLMEEYAGVAAIGHNRYATSGTADSANAQPFERVHGRMWKWFAIAFNGNLANYDTLKDNLEENGYHITYHSDTEVMMHYINREMRGDDPPDFAKMFATLTRIFDGAFNIAFINAAGDLVVMRDPLGIKPLCYAVQDDLLLVASESVVHHNLGIDEVKTLEPGEVIIANRDGYRVERFWPEEKKAYCFFEWIYFSNLASTLDGRSVYRVRRDVGRQLAEMELEQYGHNGNADAPQANRNDLPGEMVISVPETANTAASAYAFSLGLPMVNGLIRNRYVGRTFIDGGNRTDAVKMKFTPLTDVLEGKRIYLVDDTLVRGTTLKTVISVLKERGHAKEVHVRIAAPPVVSPCYYGIDMPTIGELFAPGYLRRNGDGAIPDKPDPELLKVMANDLGADSLGYLSHERLVRAVGLPEKDLCMACLNTCYPTEEGRKRYEEASREVAEAAD